MEIWAYIDRWNCPRRINLNEEDVRVYAEQEENYGTVLFFAELVMTDI